MPHIITRKVDSVEQNWLKQLANGISDPAKLLEILEIDPHRGKTGLPHASCLHSVYRKVLSIGWKKAILKTLFCVRFYP